MMAPAAQAATTVASAHTDTGPDGSFTTTFADANMPVDGMGMFTSTLDFTTLAGLLGIRVDSSANFSGGPNDTDITRVFLTGTGLASPLDLLPTPYSTDIDEHYRLYAFPVDLGSYTLTVQGIPALQNSGFTGQLVFSAGDVPNPSAVPEPGTWLLLMTGLGVIGFAMRRNRAETARGEARLKLA